MKNRFLSLIILNTITYGLYAGGGGSSEERRQKLSIIAEETTETISVPPRLLNRSSSSPNLNLDSLFGPSASSEPIKTEDLSKGIIESGILGTPPTPESSMIDKSEKALYAVPASPREQAEAQPQQKIKRPKFEHILDALQKNNTKFFVKYSESFDYKEDKRWIELTSHVDAHIITQKAFVKIAAQSILNKATAVKEAKNALAQALMIKKYVETAQNRASAQQVASQIYTLTNAIQNTKN